MDVLTPLFASLLLTSSCLGPSSLSPLTRVTQFEDNLCRHRFHPKSVQKMLRVFLILTLAIPAMKTYEDELFVDYDLFTNETHFNFSVPGNESATVEKFSGVGEQDKVGWFTFIVEGLFLSTVAVIGIFCNCFAILLIVRSFSEAPDDAESSTYQKKNREVKRMLIGLAVFDLLYLMMALSIFGLPALSQGYRNTVYIYILPIGYGMAHIGRVASVLLTLCVTLERYYSVCHPMSQLRCKRYLLPASIVFAIVYNLPKFFEIHHSFVAVDNDQEVDQNETTSLQIQLVTSDLRVNWWYVTFYLFWSKFLFIELFPYVLMVVMNYQIWKRITCLAFVQRGQRQRRSSRSTRSVRSNGQPDTNNHHRLSSINTESDSVSDFQEEEIQLARTLIMVVLVFIVCQSCKIIPDLYEVIICSQGGDRCMSTQSIEAIIDISHLMLTINSSVNFFIYIIHRGQFRESIVSLLSRGRPPVDYRLASQSYEMIPLGDNRLSEDSKRKNGVGGSRDKRKDEDHVTSNAKTHQIQVVNIVEKETKSSRKAPLRPPKIVIEEEQKSCPTDIMEYRWPFTMYYMKAYVTYDADDAGPVNSRLCKELSQEFNSLPNINARETSSSTSDSKNRSGKASYFQSQKPVRKGRIRMLSNSWQDCNCMVPLEQT